MSLRFRVLLCIGLTVAFLVLGTTLLSSSLTMRSFAEVERRDAADNVERTACAVDQMVNEVYVKSADWANWDDAYAFMKNGNRAFVRSNLAKNALENIHIDALLFVDRQGRFFGGMTLPRSGGITASRTDDILRAVDVRKRGLGPGDTARDFSGLIRLPQGTMMVSARPVLPTSGKGLARGWVVFGRLFGKDEVKVLRGLTRLDAQANEPERSANLNVTSQEVSIQALDERTIAGHMTLGDLDGRPALALSMRKPRAIYEQGLRSVESLRNLIVGAGLAFGMVVLLVLERSVLSRLSRLSDDVSRIDGEGSVRVDGRDELTTLGRKINETLARLHETELHLQRYNADLAQTVEERTRAMEFQAFHDKLTGLANRALFTNRVGLALEKANRTSLGTAAFFIDLDNFKLVNDSLGHGAGDDLLVAVAARLLDAVRPGDTVARLGGDEFTVLLEDLTDESEAQAIAGRIQASLRAPFSLEGREVFAGGSVGIAFTADGRISVEELMRDADIAMYRAKFGGKGGVVLYEESMNDEFVERLSLETALRKALDQGEMRVFYQPLVDLRTGTTGGAEALVRWIHPDRGVMPPGEFVSIAEETGLIVPIGYYVLEEACRQALQWLRESPGFTMGVNLSGRQLQRADVVDRVADILRRTGLPAENLKLEITETILMTNGDDVTNRLIDLKALGVQLALDDFGTGYSSLATLSAFPIDTLKIDRAFISRLSGGHMGEAKSIIEAIMALSRGMNMDVIGEGVETDLQKQIIADLGCRTGQGYLFDRPLSAEDFERRLHEDDFPMAA